ncbi:MAG: hypothetical protein ACRDJW_17720 [Thermomicrobiales bacterium]
MADAETIFEQAPLQDRDLLQRLSLYFDALEMRLRQGQGWFIFNAPAGRGHRIASFIQSRVTEYEPSVSACFLPWRDFALSAYVKEVGLPELQPRRDAATKDERARREYDLASRITRDLSERMLSTDLLVLTGLKPAYWHEAIMLDQTLEERYRQRLATILLTPDMPQELEAEFESVDPTRTYWERLFQRMYETSLVAL